MSPTVHNFLIWAPRVLAIATTLFLSLFALDAFRDQPLARNLLDFAIHLIPSVLLAAVIAVAWRAPWFGALVFGALGTAYAAAVFENHPNWVLIISGPLFLTALLYGVSAIVRMRERHAAA